MYKGAGASGGWRFQGTIGLFLSQCEDLTCTQTEKNKLENIHNL